MVTSASSRVSNHEASISPAPCLETPLARLLGMRVVAFIAQGT